MRQRLQVVEPASDPIEAAERQALLMVERATRAQNAASAAHQAAKAAGMRFGKEFRFAALTNDGGEDDEATRWRLCDQAKKEADEAGQRAEAASAAALIALQAAAEAQMAAQLARLSSTREIWPADSYDVDAAAFLEQHREGEAA